MFYKLLDKYIGKIIYITVMMTLLILVSLSAVIKFTEQISKTWQSNSTVLDSVYYVLFSIPKDIEIFFPMAALLGALLGLGMLAQQLQLVAMQACGFSDMQISLATLKTSIILVILSMITGEFVVPQTEKIANHYRSDHKLYNNTKLETNNGLWIKEDNDFIYIKYIKNENEIYEINIYSLTDQYHLLKIKHADKGIWNSKENKWILSKVKELYIKNRIKIQTITYIKNIWKTTLTPNKIHMALLRPNPYELSIIDLYRYSRYLIENGQYYKIYSLNMWRKLFRPFSVAVMILTAFSFIFGPLGNVTMSTRILVGIGCGFFFYILDQTFGLLSIIYDIPSILCAIIPSFVFFTISILLINFS